MTSSVPFLHRGDKIHFVIPDPGDGGQKIHDSLQAIYAPLGVQVICTTAISNLPVFQIVAVFREDRTK
jgi:hypothetical protein